MQETKTNEIYTLDYIFIPFANQNDVKLRENKIIYKDDIIVNSESKKEHSPVSGLFNGVGEINSVNGITNVIIIENDFKDTVEKKKTSIDDIYKLKSDIIKKIWKPKTSEITLEIKKRDNNDFRDEFILNDNMNIILQTLDIIDQTYPDIEIKISIDKSNLKVYQSLFSYLGTYPNIIVDFNAPSQESTVLNIYEIIDIYNDIKNCNKRDYIYLTLINNQESSVIKTKKNSNLKDLLETLEISSTHAIINDNLKLTGVNFLLDENVYKIHVK